jgi:hypothetical protein
MFAAAAVAKNTRSVAARTKLSAGGKASGVTKAACSNHESAKTFNGKFWQLFWNEVT